MDINYSLLIYPKVSQFHTIILHILLPPCPPRIFRFPTHYSNRTILASSNGVRRKLEDMGTIRDFRARHARLKALEDDRERLVEVIADISHVYLPRFANLNHVCVPLY